MKTHLVLPLWEKQGRRHEGKHGTIDVSFLQLVLFLFYFHLRSNL